MSDSKSIINFGDLGKPATVLIEKIADAIGGAARPYQILRVAKAQAEAERIRAEARIEIARREKRAIRRFVLEESRKQANMEAIIGKALPELAEGSSPENVEDDWIANFFDKCRLISDEDMQTLWAKILAGEANSPGKFAKMTVNVVSNLERTDAQLLSSLYAFAVRRIDPFPLIYGVAHKIYLERGINFESLTHLENVGLLNLNFGAMFAITNLPHRVDLEYFDRNVHIEFRNAENNSLEIGSAFLTVAGRQLATVCSAEPREGFLEFVSQEWRQRGYTVTTDQ